jgi:hypothetical protein
MARKISKNSEKPKCGDSGMTLIDLAIFMTVLGLLAVPLIQQYNDMMTTRGQDITQNNNIKIRKAIDDFYFITGRYPCPSNITLPRNDPNYGRQFCGGAPIVGQVRTGGVPFVDLRLPESASFDGWNNRIQYTVMDSLRTGSADFNPTTAAINALNFPTGRDPVTGLNFCNIPAGANPVPSNPLTTTGHYILVSFGASARGAFAREGGLGPTNQNPIQACPAAGQSRDSENCDGDLDFIDNSNQCSGSDVPGPNFYDDVTFVQTSAPQRIWVNNNQDGTRTDIASVATRVGINLPANVAPWPDGMWDNAPATVANPPPTGVDVYGNILAIQSTDPTTGMNVPNTGRVITDSICNRLGQRCFRTNSIVGVDPAMDCSNGVNPNNQGARNQALTGFADVNLADDTRPGTYDDRNGGDGTAARCRSIYNPAAGNCPPGEFARGINSNGTFRCAP